jgi:carbamate kinase
MIGYLIQQELGNELPQDKRLASLLTLIEVDPKDTAFEDPTKPIGPIYEQDESERLAKEKGWVFKPDGDSFRRVVPSPLPQRIFGVEPVEWLLEHGAVVICAGGGRIPVMYTDEPVPAGRQLVGVEAVIDKDLASALLAKDLGADALAIVTDVDAVYAGWGTPEQRAIRRATPEALADTEFAAGSMGPKVRAACSFVEESGGLAAIGSIEDTPALLRGEAGTIVTREADGLELERSPATQGAGNE